jgi:hypothetical protein
MEQGWTIDIDTAGDPADGDDQWNERLTAFEQALEPFGGAVTDNDRHDRFGARFSYDTESVNPVEILEAGLEIFHDAAIDAGLPPWQVVACEILTYAEDDARDQPE